MGQFTSSQPVTRPDLGPTDHLSRLPPELLSQVLSSLPKQQLLLTALVSRRLNHHSNLLIYRNVPIGWKEPPGVLPLVWFQRWKPEKRVKAVLDNLTRQGNDDLVRAIRRLSVANYDWYDQRKMDQLELILLRGHDNLRAVEFWSFNNDHPVMHMTPPLWTQIRSLPHLTSITLRAGPNVPLHFEQFPCLRKVDLTNYSIDMEGEGADGYLPDTVEELRLEAVDDWDARWLGEGFMGRVKVLVLERVVDRELAIWKQVCDAHAATATPSTPLPLHTLSINLFPPRHFSPADEIAVSYEPLNTLLSAFASLPGQAVKRLEVLSQPKTIMFSIDSVGFAQRLVAEWRALEQLVFFVGGGETLMSFPRPMDPYAHVLSNLPNLRLLATNVLSNSHNFPTPLEARTFLDAIPHLHRVSLRNRLRILGSFGWERQDDDQDDLLLSGLNAGAQVGGGDVPVVVDESWVEDRKDQLVGEVEGKGWAKVGRGLRVVRGDALVGEEEEEW